MKKKYHTPEERKAARAERQRQYRLEHPEKAKASQKRSQQKHRAKYMEAQKRNSARWRANNPEKVAEQARWQSKRKYGVTRESWAEMMAHQNCVCPLCLEYLDETIKTGLMKVCIDHDHKTGVVRGLVHNTCNLMLGHAKDSPETLRRAADYVEAQRASSTMDTDR